MEKSTSPRRLSRRTVAKGAAWAVPAVAVAVIPATAAASGYVPPAADIDFGNACGNTGSEKKGCGGDKTLQVPVTLTNLGAEDVVFQVTSMYTCNCGTAPVGPGANVFEGVRGVFTTKTQGSFATHNQCGVVAASTCTGGVANGSIVVPSGTNAGTYWIESVSLGASSEFSSTINWRLLATDCSVLRTGSKSADAIPAQNC